MRRFGTRQPRARLWRLCFCWDSASASRAPTVAPPSWRRRSATARRCSSSSWPTRAPRAGWATTNSQPHTLAATDAHELNVNDIGAVTIETQQALPVEAYATNRVGGFREGQRLFQGPVTVSAIEDERLVLAYQGEEYEAPIQP